MRTSALTTVLVGLLYFNEGEWQVLPAGWVATSVRHAEVPGNRGYCYQWWRLDRGGVDVRAGLGYGGQFLIVIPAHRIVGVVNSWNV